MTQVEPFTTMLAGGHPNSLGRTIEVVEIVLMDPSRFEQLYQCYFDKDEVVRLRTSNAIKRIWRQHPEWLVHYLDRFLSEISQIDQPSTQWTLAQLLLELDAWLRQDQRQRAIVVLKNNLSHADDWIVINNTLQALSKWAIEDIDLKTWLKPQILRLKNDKRKSVARTAEKLFDTLFSE